MARAYVLFNVESGMEEQVLKRIYELDLVDEGYVSYGVYDLVVKTKDFDMEKLKEVITRKLRTIEGVRSTLTLIMTG